MRRFALASDAVRLAVTEFGGMLEAVTFDLDGRPVAPMHTAPWADESLPDDVPAMLRNLRGDFLAAPFGASDVIESERRPHGLTANGLWLERARSDERLELELDGSVMGASVRKVVELRSGQAVVYQRHEFHGGSGRLPLGHHAMLRAPAAASPLRLSFGPWFWAGTPPVPIEIPPSGRSALRYPQRIADLTRARLRDGGTTDLTRFPVLDASEDVWMLSARPGRAFGWTAAVCQDEGWAWFSLKDPRVLPSTVVWLSNGGRDYPPFSGRHLRVIGLEEVCADFHLGHRASLDGGEPAAHGVPTTLELKPDRTLVVAYAFGLAAVPGGFGAVREVRDGDGDIVLVGEDGTRVRVPFDVSALFPTNSGHEESR